MERYRSARTWSPSDGLKAPGVGASAAATSSGLAATSRNLGAILIRRMMDVDDAGENPPSRGCVLSTSLADIAAFITGKTDDQKLEDLIWGLALVGNQTSIRPSPYRDEEFILPRAYALLKLTLLPGSLEWEEHHGVMALQLRQSSGGETPTGVSVRPEPATLAQLLVGHISEACAIAARRLRACGLVPLASRLADGSRRDTEWSASGVSSVRLLASLLFPISRRSVTSLADQVLRRPAVETLA